MIKENFVELIHHSLVKFWDNPMYTDYPDDNIVSYKQVAEKVKELHLLFDTLDIRKGDKISIIGKNSSGWATAYIATVSYGCVIVPILHDFNPDDMHHIVNHSDSAMLFCDVHTFKMLKSDQMPKLKLAVMLDNFGVENINDDFIVSSLAISEKYNNKYPNGLNKDQLDFAKVDNKELVVLNYTSGTTGFSKGVMISGNSLAGNITFGRDHIPLDEGTKMVSFLPLAHTYGCAFDFLLGMVMGVHTYFISKTPSPQVLLPAFKLCQPQVIISVPLILEKIYKKKIIPTLQKPSMKILLKIPGINNIIHNKIRNSLIESFGGRLNELILGGAPLNAEAEEFFRKIKFPITIGYGMTECGPLISYDSWKTTRPNCAGKLLDAMEMKIESKDPYSIPGEICVRGEHVMDGYYKNEEATNEVLDAEGWLHTGDMGITDADKYIYIRGRSKNMLLGPSGQNIYPEEIEAVLNNLPYVAESLVLQDKNHKLYALVYADAESVKTEELSEEQLEEEMEKNRRQLNKLVRKYETLSRIKIHRQEFIKTPKKSIKRYLYEDKE